METLALSQECDMSIIATKLRGQTFLETKQNKKLNTELLDNVASAFPYVIPIHLKSQSQTDICTCTLVDVFFQNILEM